MTAVLSRGHTAAADGTDIGDPELVELGESVPWEREERNAACEKLVGRYESLVRACAQRYRHSPESPEELMQVGYVGLLKAINNFDPSFGSNLASYAQPCIAGEIKRHFRDKRWHVHVKRSTQEMRLELCRARAELTQQLSRAPKRDELAEHVGISADVQRAALASQASSLDARRSAGPDPGNLADILGEDDPKLEHTLDIESVWAHWGDLPEREQRLLMMRFYGNMTQAEIGERLGISQMHVSRLLAGALSYLRERVLGQDGGSEPRCTAAAVLTERRTAMRSATGTGLTLIAFGAILAFAVQGHPSWLNIQIVGWVFMLTGIVAMAVPRRGYGWLRRRMVLRRGPGGRPVVDRMEEKHYPPYVMLNPGGNTVPGEVVSESGNDGPATVSPAEEPGRDSAPVDEREAEGLARDREAVVDRTKAEWQAAEQAARPGDPLPTEEVVEQYVEE